MNSRRRLLAISRQLKVTIGNPLSDREELRKRL
jgi:hypothetical protein